MVGKISTMWLNCETMYNKKTYTYYKNRRVHSPPTRLFQKSVGVCNHRLDKSVRLNICTVTQLSEQYYILYINNKTHIESETFICAPPETVKSQQAYLGMVCKCDLPCIIDRSSVGPKSSLSSSLPDIVFVYFHRLVWLNTRLPHSSYSGLWLPRQGGRGAGFEEDEIKSTLRKRKLVSVADI